MTEKQIERLHRRLHILTTKGGQLTPAEVEWAIQIKVQLDSLVR